MKTWSVYREFLVTTQSIVSSFIYHTECKMASRCSDCANWREGKLDTFYILCPQGRLLSNGLIFNMFVRPRNVQVQNFLMKTQGRGNI